MLNQCAAAARQNMEDPTIPLLLQFARDAGQPDEHGFAAAKEMFRAISEDPEYVRAGMSLLCFAEMCMRVLLWIDQGKQQSPKV
jgi:hypothetical protein